MPPQDEKYDGELDGELITDAELAELDKEIKAINYIVKHSSR